MPTVSIIIPAYNHENYVRECIQSILNQTYQDFEIIITDDGSTDRTVEIIKSFSDPRIKLFLHSRNRGTPTTINDCVRHASGTYIAALGSDDAWYPEKLSLQVRYLEEHPDIAAVFSKVDWVDESSKLIPDEQNPYKDLFNVQNRTRFEWLRLFFEHGNCLNHPSSLMRKYCLEEVGYLNPLLQGLHDFDLWIRTCFLYDIWVMDETLVRYRWASDHSNVSGNTKQNNIRYRFEYKQILDHYLQITKPDELLAIFPDASMYGKVTTETIPYFLGRFAMDTGDEYKVAWGQETLFALLQNKRTAQAVVENCSFTYFDFNKLIKENDIYNLEILKTLNAQVAEQDQAIQMLSAQAASKEETVQALTTQIQEIRKSNAWKIALLLQRIGLRLAPPESLRGRFLRRAARVLFFPFMKIRQSQRIKQDLSLIRASGLFDEKWYLQHSPDVARLGIDPMRHYLLFGGVEGRDPGPHFSSRWYLDAYEDVRLAGVNPLIHFLEKGIPEGRQTGPDQVMEESTSQASEIEQKLQAILRHDHQQVLDDVYTRLGDFLRSGEVVELPVYEEPVVSIGLLFHNRAEMSLQCLQSLVAGAGQVPFEVIIVDNASTDNTSALLERIRNARILRNPANLGFGGGYNKVAELAVGKYLFLLNNDTQLLPDSLQVLVGTLESDPTIGAVGGKLIFPDGRLQEAGSIIWRDGSCLGYGRFDDPFKGEYCYVRDVDFCSAALLLTPRQLFLDLGGFDARYAPAYYEDADYCMQLWTQGYRVVFQPFAAAIHHEFGSSGAERALALQREHRRIFVDKWSEQLERFELPDPAHIITAREHRNDAKRILFIDDRIPDTRLGSGYPRTYRMLEMLAEMGCRITFFPMQISAYVPDIARALQLQGIEVLYAKTEREDPEQKINFEEFMATRPDYYDVIFLSRPHNMQEALQPLKTHARSTPIVYDAEALFSLRDIKFRELNGEQVSKAEKERLVRDEVALVKAASTVITVSELEKEQFARHGTASVHVLGHILEPHPTPALFEQRHDILFVSSIMTDPSPNSDAVRYFATQVLPLVRQEIDCQFYIVGTNRIKAIWNLESEFVHVVGKVEDLTPYYNRSRLFVVPTRYSAGIPLKLLEASAHGLPAVVTPLTASQLGWRVDHDLLVGYDPEDFARKVIDLYTSPALFETLRQNALQRIRLEYSPAYFRSTLEHILRLAINRRNRQKHAIISSQTFSI